MKRNAPTNSRRGGAAHFGNASTDDAYCHMIARRSVVRAALYLGIESMSQEALDTVAGVLLEYLSRIGSTLAASVEASGRSSAHCNVMDALRVVELLTPPGNPVMAPVPSNALNATGDDGILGVTHGSVNDNMYNLNSHPESFTSWKDLAVFCFGPDWIDRGTEMRRQQQENRSEDSDGKPFGTLVNGFNMNGSNEKSTTGRSTGGKKLNLPLSGGGGVTLSIDGVGVVRPGSDVDGDMPLPIVAGWNAPYPDELPNFPVCANDRNVANPHTLLEQRFHSLNETDIIQDHEVDEATTRSRKDLLDASNRQTTTSVSSATIVQSIRNMISSLDEIPDEIFANDKRYTTDFFAPAEKKSREKLSNEAAGTTVTGDVTMSTNPSISVSNGTSDEKATSMNSSNINNAKLDEHQTSLSSEPMKKKVKIAPGTNVTSTQSNPTNTASNVASINNESFNESNTGGDETNQVDYVNRPLYVPTFYPPFPSRRPTVAQTFLDFEIGGGKPDAMASLNNKSVAVQRRAKRSADSLGSSSLRDIDITRSVRSALIHLGQQNEHQVWGSYTLDANKIDHDVVASINNPDGNDQDQKQRATRSGPGVVDTKSLFVPAGLAGDVSTTQQASSTIVPLNRASGSRISRILEGSMDAPTM
jgi:hypothetical protein